MTRPTDALGEELSLLMRDLQDRKGHSEWLIKHWPTVVHALVSESGPLDQDALYRASWELQRHFGREGSIYGIKACEEIARIAIVAYGKRRTVGEEKQR